MKAENWKYVKAGDTLIYARTDLGVKQARVVEIDIIVEEEYPTLHREQPFGLTADQGFVRIQYDSTIMLENLKDLITFSLVTFNDLTRAYDEWRKERTEADAYEDVYNALMVAYKER